MKHTLKKKAAPLNATLRIVISKDIISFMYDLYHLSLLLLELPHRLHPEGNVQHELNVFYFFSDVHTTLFQSDGEWDCVGCRNIPSIGLFYQSCTLAREVNKLALTVHNSTSHTLLLLEFVTHFVMSNDVATVLGVLCAQVLLIAPVCKKGCVHPPVK